MKQKRNFHSAVALGLAVAIALSALVWAFALKSSLVIMGVDFIR
jgi:hypothetical protein